MTLFTVKPYTLFIDGWPMAMTASMLGAVLVYCDLAMTLSSCHWFIYVKQCEVIVVLLQFIAGPVSQQITFAFVHTPCLKNNFPPLNSVTLSNFNWFSNFCTAEKSVWNLQQNPYDTTHRTLGMLLHYLGKLHKLHLTLTLVTIRFSCMQFHW